MPRTWIGVRTVSGLKSFGATTPRKSSASVASESEPSTHSVESCVATTNTFGPHHAILDDEVADVARDAQRLVALHEQADRLRDVEPTGLHDQVRERRIAQLHAQAAVEGREDLGRRAALSRHLDLAIEAARDVRLPVARQVEPLLEADALQPQVGVVARALGAAVESDRALQLALSGAARSMSEMRSTPPASVR